MALSMRRVNLLVTVALVMAAMMVAMAVPAFVKAAEGIGGGAGEGKECAPGTRAEGTRSFAPGQVEKSFTVVTCPA
jgi:hypothetical protein